MERSIRIGKDFNVRWSINKVVDGERQPYELAGKELVLRYRTPYGLKEATEWKVVGNTIVWTFRGKEQKALGSYELILTENGGKDGMVTVDTCRAFKLVAHSCEETEGSGSDIVIEDVVLESEVTFAALRGPQGEQGPAGPSYDDTEIKGKLAELSEEIAEVKTLSFPNSEGFWSGAVAANPKHNEDANATNVRAEVLANQVLHIKGMASSMVAAYMLLDANGNVMVSQMLSSIEVFDLEVTIPEGAAEIIVNSYRYRDTYVEASAETIVNVPRIILELDSTNKRLGEKMDGIETDIDVLSKGILTSSLLNNMGFWMTSPTLKYVEDINATYVKAEAMYGQVWHIKGMASSAIPAYILLDAMGNVVHSQLPSSIELFDLEINIPNGVSEIIVNSYKYRDTYVEASAEATYNVPKKVEELARVTRDMSLLGKTIVCFGDSITEMKDVTNGKSYTDVLHEMTGANFINVGVGGSQIRCRTEIFEEFSASKSYAIGDCCIYGVRIYQFTAEHKGEWNANDVKEFAYQSQAYSNLDVFSLIKASAEKQYDDALAACKVIKETQNDDNTETITRLASVDWTKVDAITIFAGTNDWANANTLGTKGSSDPTKTLGAINEIMRIFISAYPNIKVFWFTPVVRWLSFNNGSTNDAQFSDNYSVEGNGTLKEECSAIIEEVTSNHIPICDFYNNFGWNKYNCTEYFTGTDGTHPRTSKGVKYIAEKMLRFLLANKTF